MENFLKALGRNVNRWRKTRGLTQEEAAKQSEISYRYFQKIESGAANMTVGTLFRVVKLLDVHVCDLLPEK